MSLVRNDGNWHVDFYDQHGRRRRKKVGRNKKLAEKVERKILQEVAEKKFKLAGENRTTFQELAREYREYLKTRTFYKADEYRLIEVEKKFGKMRLDQISVHDIEKFKRVVAARGKIGWNRIRALLHRMFVLGKQWELCDDNPVSRVSKYKENPGKTRFLSPDDELPRYLAVAAEPDLPRDSFALVVFALFTGLRKSEQFRLRWDEVDFARGVIHVNKLGKSKKSREIPMTRLVRQVLLEQQERTGDKTFVFCHGNGKLFRDRKETLKAILCRAGIQDFTWHDMRHCFASYLAMSGVDLFVIQRLLGHSDIKMTMRYAHLSPSFLQESIGALEKFEPNSQTLALKTAIEKDGGFEQPEMAFLVPEWNTSSDSD